MDPPKSPNFLTLPPEIRLEIYDQILRFDGIEPKISWIEPFDNGFRKWCAMERGSYISPKLKPKPWPIKVRLDILSPLREDPLADDGAAASLPRDRERAPPEEHRAQIAEQQRDWIRLETLLQLLRTSRKIYTEARGIFWSRNRFLVRGSWALFYFQYGLGARRLRCITSVALKGWEYIASRYTAEGLTEFLLGRQGRCPMSNVSSDFCLEYQFVRKILDAVETRSDGFNGKVKRCGRRFAERQQESWVTGEEANDTAMAVVDSATGQVRSSIDILGEAIQLHNKGQQERQMRSRGSWHIEYEPLGPGDDSRRLIWLTNRHGTYK
ncbi:MAG: hypothetical protein LQ346_004859 [Caloplaca aetnensis]|nr:MAG: hypothetical protein LQ346_004859 [Caloplaca aetnensis]